MDTIAVAVAEAGGEERRYGVIPNQLEDVRRMAEELRAPATKKPVPMDTSDSGS